MLMRPQPYEVEAMTRKAETHDGETHEAEAKTHDRGKFYESEF